MGRAAAGAGADDRGGVVRGAQQAPLPGRPGAVRARQPRRGVHRRGPALRADRGDRHEGATHEPGGLQRAARGRGPRSGWPPASTCRAGSTTVLAARPYADVGRAARRGRAGRRPRRRRARGRAGPAPADRRAGRRRPRRGALGARAGRRRPGRPRRRRPDRGGQRGLRGAVRPGLPDPRLGPRPARRSWPSSSGGWATTTRPSGTRPCSSCARSRCCGWTRRWGVDGHAEHPRPGHRARPAGRRAAGRAHLRAEPRSPRASPTPTAGWRRWAASSRTGDYTLRFDTGGYLGVDAFYPEVVVDVRGRRRRALPRAAAAQPVRLLDLPWLLTSSIRARRAVVDGREVAASVRVRDGVIAGGREPDRRRRPAPRWWSSPTTRCCCPAWSTPTSTSTSPAAPSGRASPARPGPPPRAG